jgi:sulfite exporter TauE/SafE
MLGVLWGWLPCGLVYATLILALMSGSALDGATILAAFGLGTLPNVLALAFAANWVSAAARNVNVRRAAGFITAAFGLAGLSRVAGIPLDAVALAELCFTR